MSHGTPQPGDPAVERAATPGQPTAEGTTRAPSGSQDENVKSHEELRRDIEQTREELGDTVDALSQKADVKAQVKGAVDEQKAQLRAKGEELKQKVSSGDGDSGDASQRAKALLDDVAQRTSRQPLPSLGGALLAGLLIGRRLHGGRNR